MKGKYISLVGIDGAGKTTQAGNLSCELRKKNYNVDIYRQFETTIGQQCKEILSSTTDPYLRAFLFALAHYAAKDKILNSLEDNDFVISDRSPYCAVAYLVPQGIPEGWVLSLYQYLAKPDIVIFLDVPVDIAVKRKPFDDLIPVKTLDFLDQVRRSYLKLVEKGYLLKINGNLTEKEVTEEILQLLMEIGAIKK